MQNNFPQEIDEEEEFLTDFELVERVMDLPLEDRDRNTVLNLINATKCDDIGSCRLQPSQRRWFTKQLERYIK